MTIRRESRLCSSAQSENELLAALREQILPEQEISPPTSGLRYFALEDNHKPRQLWLCYRGADEPIHIPFERRQK